MTTATGTTIIDINSGRWGVECRIDTRLFDEAGKPISGSGDFNSCNCCGKDHEVWVYIKELKTNQKAIVGTECAKKAPVHKRNLLSKNYTLTRSNPYFYSTKMNELKYN